MRYLDALEDLPEEDWEPIVCTFQGFARGFHLRERGKSNMPLPTIQVVFAAVTDPAALDLFVSGRDIPDLFAVIIDRPGNVVCLLSQRHRYAIIQD